MTGFTNTIAKLNADLKEKDDAMCEMMKYQRDLEGIIKRQHLEMDNMRDELRVRGSELNKRNVKVDELRSECKELHLSRDETNVKIRLLLRKVRELEEEMEYGKCVA